MTLCFALNKFSIEIKLMKMKFEFLKDMSDV